MSFELEDVRRVLDAFETSDWDEIRLTGEGFKLHVVSRSAGAAGLTFDPAATAAQRPTPTPAWPPTPTPVAPLAPHEEPPGRSALNGEPQGESIKAPALGVFWRSPQPGAPPFVEVGDHVELDTTVCIVEVMKLMTPVKAGVTGRITAVLAENGGYIDRGQPLFTYEVEVDTFVDLADAGAPTN